MYLFGVYVSALLDNLSPLQSYLAIVEYSFNVPLQFSNILKFHIIIRNILSFRFQYYLRVKFRCKRSIPFVKEFCHFSFFKLVNNLNLIIIIFFLKVKRSHLKRHLGPVFWGRGKPESSCFIGSFTKTFSISSIVTGLLGSLSRVNCDNWISLDRTEKVWFI